MRLLNTSTYSLHDSEDEVVMANPDYAVVSHRWEPGNNEITFQRFNPTDLRSSNSLTPSLAKIKNACAKAREQSLYWLWIDTCCIDKTNSKELGNSLNSMFKWYQEATVCYAYLKDVVKATSGPQMFKSFDSDWPDQKSEWFKRGWTLQELLAPQYMEFYDHKWNFMGTRKKLAGDLQLVTDIDKIYLNGDRHFKKACVATRMSWMAGRTTQETEDIAYSMLGIFNVNMSPQYGEGDKAFIRLQRALIEAQIDESIFAWTIPPKGLLCYLNRLDQYREWAPDNWGLLAPSPDCFTKEESSKLVILSDRVVLRAYGWSQQAVQLQMPQKSGTEATNFFGLPRKKITLSLNCWRCDTDETPFIIQIELLKVGGVYTRVQCDRLGKKRNGRPANNSVIGIDQMVTRAVPVAQPDLDLSNWPLVGLREPAHRV
jgi:Heterokaryon incompatibility protein (HET)